MMDHTRGMTGPTKTTTTEQEWTRWLSLNKYHKKISDLTKEMVDGGYDEVIRYHDDMIKTLILLLEKIT